MTVSMSKKAKLLDKVLGGAADANISFTESCHLLLSLGFTQRQKGGSHTIFNKEGVEEILNLQPIGSKAKSYQVAQVRDVIRKYQLSL